MTRDGVHMFCGVVLLRPLPLHPAPASAGTQESHRASLGVKGTWPCLLLPSLGFKAPSGAGAWRRRNPGRLRLVLWRSLPTAREARDEG